MMSKAYQERLITLVRDTLSLLCKNGLEYNEQFAIEGLLGVTLDKNEVFLIPIKELVADKGVGTKDSSDDLEVEEELPPEREGKKRRRRAVHSTEALDEPRQQFSGNPNERSSSLSNRIPDQEFTPKRSRISNNDADLADVKEEDIVFIKEEDDEDIMNLQDNSLEHHKTFPPTDTGDPNMPYFPLPADINFSMDQLPSGSGLQGTVDGDQSWLQDSTLDEMSPPSGLLHGLKHQVYYDLGQMSHTGKTSVYKRVPCDLCEKTFTRPCRLQAHKKTVHHIE